MIAQIRFILKVFVDLKQVQKASAEKTKIQCRHEEAAQNYRLAEEVAAQLLKAERRNIKKATTYFGNLTKTITYYFYL